MKLQLNYPIHFYLGNNNPIAMVSPNSIIESKTGKASTKNIIKKIKNKVIKLTPLHWYDEVWDDLDFKM